MQLFGNPLVNLSVLSWMAAQVIKTILHWLVHGRLNMERLTGSGGMPSSHSAFVVSLTIGVARREGVTSSIFALCIAFAVVVMYDAMGVRRAAGEQAKRLNQMIGSFEDFAALLRTHTQLEFDENDGTETDDLALLEQDGEGDAGSQKALKEYLGHTPLEVMAGALLGILIAMIYPL